MKHWNRVCFIVGVLLWMIPQLGYGCTTFCLDHEDGPVFGRNYDWHLGDGLIMVNQRNVAKTAFVQENPVRWVSKYGSVTFNQYGRELPAGGMNEAGLIVEQMSLRTSQCPAPDERPSVSELQWIQYQLDNSCRIEDVVASESRIRLAAFGKTLHYLVCDQTGQCVSVESLDGRMVYRSGETMPVKVLSNSAYAKSASTWKCYRGLARPFLRFAEEKDSDSLTRFVRAANMVSTYSSTNSIGPVDYAFKILEKVAQGGGTQWRIVYDIPKGHIYFRTLENPQIRHFDLNALNFSCSTSAKILDVNTVLSGDVTDKFVDYTRELHQELIEKTYKNTSFLADLPNEIIEQIVSFPERAPCIQ